MRRHHELPFGAELTEHGARFRLWAPRAHEVELLLENIETDPLPMTAEPNGWFSLMTGEAGPGARYRYQVDGSAYPDPASRYQPDGVHGASEVIDPDAYQWRDAEWRGHPWHELVLYELHLGTFSESGDFTGAIAHLDHLIELGITAIELMPIAEFPGQRNWGYDGAQWFAPSSCYGRPEELKVSGSVLAAAIGPVAETVSATVPRPTVAVWYTIGVDCPRMRRCRAVSWPVA